MGVPASSWGAGAGPAISLPMLLLSFASFASFADK